MKGSAPPLLSLHSCSGSHLGLTRNRRKRFHHSITKSVWAYLNTWGFDMLCCTVFPFWSDCISLYTNQKPKARTGRLRVARIKIARKVRMGPNPLGLGLWLQVHITNSWPTDYIFSSKWCFLHVHSSKNKLPISIYPAKLEFGTGENCAKH